MNHRDNRLAALPNLANQPHHIETRRHVHERRWFVKQHDRRILR